MWTLPLLWWMACAPDVGPAVVIGTDADPDPDTIGGEDPDTDVDTDTQVELPPPDLEVDVLVVGSGPAGLAAADAAVEAGASVLVLERAATMGGNGAYANRYFAVGTPYQAEAGIEDDVAAALADWPALTLGGDASDPRVTRFLERSAEIVSWVVAGLGTPMIDVVPDLEFDVTPRLHALGQGPKSPTMKLAARHLERVRTAVEADGIVKEDGRVVGVTWRDLTTGETGWTRARGGVVIAAGGFGRALDRVASLHPEVADVLGRVEIGPTAVGAAIPWVEEGGAALQDRAGIGFFVHSVADPRPGEEDEVLYMPAAHRMLYVNADGQRVANERLSAGFRLVDVLLAQDEPRLFAFGPRRGMPRLEVPAYNVVDGVTGFSIEDAEAIGALAIADSPRACADALGIEAVGLDATVASYNAIAENGVDAEFGKPVDDAVPLRDGPGAVVCAEMVVAASKSYTGFATDYDQHLVDANGAPIEGLFGAGEFVGMLGSSGMGGGTSGTITAVLLTGRIAGESAAREAHP